MNGAIPGRRWWGATLLACLAAVLAGLATPVPLPEEGMRTDPLDALPEDAADSAREEDLGAFLENRRWGASLREILEAEAEKARQAGEPQPAINPALAKMGFVGLIVTAGRSAVLLEAPEGGVARFAPGDVLPDGRTLVSVTDNSLTLNGDGRDVEVLTLFPPVRPDPLDGGDGDSPVRPGGDAGGSAGAAVPGDAG